MVDQSLVTSTWVYQYTINTTVGDGAPVDSTLYTKVQRSFC